MEKRWDFSATARSVCAAVMTLLVAGAVAGCKDFTYEARSQVVDGISGAFELRMVVEEIVMAQGRYPNATELANWAVGPFGNVRYKGIVDPDTGVISVTFTQEVAKPIRGQSLRFEPSMVENHELKWRCVSDEIDPHFLPANCR